MTVSFVASWAEVCEHVAEFVGHPGDPFVGQTIVVPGVAHGRHLSQTLSRRLGGVDGVCTGIDFPTMHAFRRQLEQTFLGIDASADPWRTRGLTLTLLDIIDASETESWFEPVARHIAQSVTERPGRRLATAERIARLFRGYLDHATSMLGNWQAGTFVDAADQPLASGDAWQPELWGRVASLLEAGGHADPATRAEQLIEAIAQRPHLLPERIGAVSTMGLRPTDHRLLMALGDVRPVAIWQLRQVQPAQGQPSPLARRYGVVEAAAVADLGAAAHAGDSPIEATGSLLTALQSDIRANRPPADGSRRADGTVQIHACHGPDRQVEVLREVLCDLFETDPTLQPRDVVICCPDPAAYAPLFGASFGLLGADGARLHPGHSLRVQTAASSLTSLNPVLDVVSQVASLTVARAEAQLLIDLASATPVAKKFGFTADDLEAITELVSAAHIRWGVDRSSRERFGLGEVTQSTWLAGVDRMLTGVALSGNPPTAIDQTTPLDRVSSSDLDVIGGLAELVSRLRKCLLDFSTPAPAAVWVSRLRGVIDLLADVDHDDLWQLNHAHTELSAIADLAPDRRALLSLGDVRVLLDQLLRPSRGRPNFFNGGLTVASLTDMHALPHRVICLIGIDDDHFPPRLRRDGDDLTLRGGAHRPPLFDARLIARQALLDAVLAASEKLVVITQGADPRSNEPKAPSIAILDLINACAVPGPAGAWQRESSEEDARRLVRHHSLQAYGWGNFTSADGPPLSFDRAAAEGARARRQPRQVAPLAWAATYPGVDESVVALDDLISFYANPAASLLRVNAGIRRTDFQPTIGDELPLSLNGLERWAVGDELVNLMVGGADPISSARALALGGKLPPAPFRAKLLNDVGRVAETLATTVRGLIDGATVRDIAVEASVGRHTVVGQLRAHDNKLLFWRSGRLRGVHIMSAWISLLAARATNPRPLDAMLVKNDGTYVVPAPNQAAALTILGQLVHVREVGLRQVLPLPIETSAHLAGVLPMRRGPWTQDAVTEAKGAWNYECDGSWRHFFPTFADLFVPAQQADDPMATSQPTSRIETLSHWLWADVRVRKIQVDDEGVRWH